MLWKTINSPELNMENRMMNYLIVIMKMIIKNYSFQSKFDLNHLLYLHQNQYPFDAKFLFMKDL